MKLYSSLKPQSHQISQQFNHSKALEARITKCILRYSKPEGFCDTLKWVCFRITHAILRQRTVNKMVSDRKDQPRDLIIRVLDENKPLSALPQATKLKLAKNIVIPLKKAFYQNYDTLLRALLRQQESSTVESAEELAERKKRSSKNLFNAIFQNISADHLIDRASPLNDAL